MPRCLCLPKTGGGGACAVVFMPCLWPYWRRWLGCCQAQLLASQNQQLMLALSSPVSLLGIGARCFQSDCSLFAFQRRRQILESSQRLTEIFNRWVWWVLLLFREAPDQSALAPASFPAARDLRVHVSSRLSLSPRAGIFPMKGFQPLQAASPILSLLCKCSWMAGRGLNHCCGQDLRPAEQRQLPFPLDS